MSGDKSKSLSESKVVEGIKVGSEVTYTYKDKEHTGKVLRVYDCHLDNVEKCRVSADNKKGCIYKPTKTLKRQLKVEMRGCCNGGLKMMAQLAKTHSHEQQSERISKR